MKRHRNPLLMVVLSMMLSILACVTINIYFPAEKVESVAEEIVHEIRSNKPEVKEQSLRNEEGFLLQEHILALTCSFAWADDVTAVSNPTIRASKEKMKSRYSQMKPYYQKGMLKEGANGYVSLWNTEGLGLKERRNFNNLIDAENENRKTLYKEIAKALNIDPSQTNKIAEIFAKEWQK